MIFQQKYTYNALRVQIGGTVYHEKHTPQAYRGAKVPINASRFNRDGYLTTCSRMDMEEMFNRFKSTVADWHAH